MGMFIAAQVSHYQAGRTSSLTLVYSCCSCPIPVQVCKNNHNSNMASLWHHSACQSAPHSHPPNLNYVLLAGQQQQYILTSEGLLEVNRVKHAASSWLVGDTFVSGDCLGWALSVHLHPT